MLFWGRLVDVFQWKAWMRRKIESAKRQTLRICQAVSWSTFDIPGLITTTDGFPSFSLLPAGDLGLRPTGAGHEVHRPAHAGAPDVPDAPERDAALRQTQPPHQHVPLRPEKRQGSAVGGESRLIFKQEPGVKSGVPGNQFNGSAVTIVREFSLRRNFSVTSSVFLSLITWNSSETMQTGLLCGLCFALLCFQILTQINPTNIDSRFSNRYLNNLLLLQSRHSANE